MRTFGEKLVALAELCGPPVNYGKPLLIGKRRHLFGLFPVTGFDARLCVGDYGSAWRALVSDHKHHVGPLKGADFSMRSRRVDAWTLEGEGWIEAESARAFSIGERITKAVSHAYEQCCAGKK